MRKALLCVGYSVLRWWWWCVRLSPIYTLLFLSHQTHTHHHHRTGSRKLNHYKLPGAVNYSCAECVTTSTTAPLTPFQLLITWF